MTSEMIVEVSKVSKSYQEIHVLKEVSLSINHKEVVSIMGSSGAGKSTLLHIIGTLEKPDSGSVSINKKNVFSLNDSHLADFRNLKIGFVFQFHQLLPEFSALENVCMPAWIAKKNKAEVTKKATELLELLGLKHRASHKPSSMSGGEQQRVAIARALINNPDIVLADEPTGNLDSTNANAIHDLFLTLREKMNQTFLIVTHNENLAKISDRVLMMKDGRIVTE